MRLTKTTSYAIRILVDCAAAEGALVKTADIAKRLDITPLNVFKIVHILSHAGYIEAVRGRNGGVKLASPAKDITIGAVVRDIEATEIAIEKSGRRDKNAKVQLNDIFDDALEAFIGVLDQYTLAELARGKQKKAQTKAKLRNSAANQSRSASARG